MSNNPYIGSSFDDFLTEEGILDECTKFAIDKVSEWQESNKNKVLQSPDCVREGDRVLMKLGKESIGKE
jgi:hypothetical protein